MTDGENPRLFTAEEATRTLPLVASIAGDIAEENDRLQTLLPALRSERLRARRTGDAGDLEAIRERVARSSARLETYLDELRQVGCILHEPTGVIDFRSVLHGRPVALCWRLGDPEVGHWHEPGRSHVDRRPLPNAFAASGAGCDADD
ncbi:MAG: DUF2203 domain-containing protein [Gemmatimonadota bacterium]|jgi:hypothetical protein